MAEQAIRVTLSTGKKVLLRVPKIKHQEQALRMVGKRAQGNPELSTFLTGVEMVKILLAKVDETEYQYKDFETKSIDDLFSNNEMRQLGKALQQYMGEEDDFLPQIEAVHIGA